MPVSHTFVSAIADDPTSAANGEVLPSHWNAVHTVSINLSGAEATGTLAAARFPALTGDITTSAGSLATTIKNNVALSGSPTTTTQAAADNSTKIATTAYADTAAAAKLSTTLTNAHIFVGNASNVATDVAVSGDITIANTGVVSFDLTKTHAWTGQQYFAQISLTDASPITWNLNTQQAAYVLLTSGVGATRQLQNPSNMQAGSTYTLIVQQSSTGTNALTYGTNYKFPGGTAPVLSTANNAIDILTFISDGSVLYGVIQKAFS